MLAGATAFALKGGNLDGAIQLIRDQTDSGQVSAATLFVRKGAATQTHAFGKAQTPDAVFLLASITKPMTASALMTLIDRHQVSLSDPVQRFIPEFRGDGRERVLIHHLLTHTSGLPDMLPENEDLRKRHAPLAEFVNTPAALHCCSRQAHSFDIRVWEFFLRRRSRRVSRNCLSRHSSRNMCSGRSGCRTLHLVSGAVQSLRQCFAKFRWSVTGTGTVPTGEIWPPHGAERIQQWRTSLDSCSTSLIPIGGS